LRSAVDLVGPYCHTLKYSPPPIHHVDHVGKAGRRHCGERTKAEDDSKASDRNEQEPGKMRQCGHRRRGVRGLAGSGAGWATIAREE
jgi:hypothetical protein